LDSLSQVVLGAGVGELLLGRKMRNKAQLLGAIAGTIPDLDVFLNFLANTPEEALRIHRSYCHAAFPQLFIALPFAYITYRIFKKQYSFILLYLLFYLGFLTHALLDCCTTYGTQFFLPFSNFLVGFNNIAVVDPLYTIPFLLLLLICLFLKRSSNLRFNIACLAMFISTAYIGWATLNKFKAEKVFATELQKRNINYTKISTSPVMFNAVLWNLIAINDSILYVADYSIFQKNKQAINLISFKRNKHLLAPFQNDKTIQTLDWFSNDLYFIEQGNADTLNYFNVKWGKTVFDQKESIPTFLFYLKVYKNKNGHTTFKEQFPKSSLEEYKKYLSIIKNRILID
jgi:inner membrane protein